MKSYHRAIPFIEGTEILVEVAFCYLLRMTDISSKIIDTLSDIEGVTGNKSHEPSYY